MLYRRVRESSLYEIICILICNCLDVTIEEMMKTDSCISV